MIKKPGNFENTNAYGDFETLKPGGYKCVIRKVECNETSNGKQYLKVSYDIAEGENKDFYKNKYLNDQRTDKKWSGVWTVFTDGYEPNSTNKKFKGFTTALEESNAGYKFDWDENKLENKRIGLVMHEEEFETQTGEVKTAVKPLYAMSYDKVEDAKIPKMKELPEKGDSFEKKDDWIEDDSLDLPF